MPALPAFRPGIPDSLAGLDAQGRLVFKAQILVQPDAAAVNAALGAPGFQPAQPSLSIVPAVDSGAAGGAGVPPGSEAAPAIATSSSLQPVQLQGALVAASVDVGSAGTVTAGTLSSALLSTNVARAATITASQVTGDALQASGAVTAASFTTPDGSVSISADSAAVGPLLAHTLAVQQTVRGENRGGDNGVLAEAGRRSRPRLAPPASRRLQPACEREVRAPCPAERARL